MLDRLDALPRRRHSDWLRGLLIQGFLAECRVVHQLTAPANAGGTPGLERVVRPGLAFADARVPLGQTRRAGSMATGTRRQLAQEASAPGGAEKPFAHLRKVVG